MKDDDLSSLRVVLIDDSRSFLSLLTDVLHGFGIRNITRSSDAIEAFEIIEREVLDIALVDYDMPLVNGLEFASMVRTAPDSHNKFLSMILVTSQPSRQVVTDSIKAGFDDILAKPMRPDHLRRKLLQLKNAQKQYILTPSGYFGPDRRRRADPNYVSDERRKKDYSMIVSPYDIRIVERVQGLAAMGRTEEVWKLWDMAFNDLTAQSGGKDEQAPDAEVEAPSNPIKTAMKIGIRGALARNPPEPRPFDFRYC